MEKYALELLNQLPDAIVLTSIDGSIRGWFGGCTEIFGITSDEALGMNLCSLLRVKPEDLQITDEFSGGILYKHEGREDKTVRIVKIFPLKIPDISKGWIFRDVTDRLKVESFMTSYYDDVHSELEKIVAEKTADLRRLNEELEIRVIDRTKELELAQKKLITQAHQSGMAEIAIGTLHNIGNILNNIVTSVFIIDEILEEGTIVKFKKANALLKERFTEYIDSHKINVAEYELLINYFFKVEEKLTEEISSIRRMSGRLGDKTLDINNIIIEQSRYANSIFYVEDVSLNELLDEVLFYENYDLEENKVTVVKHYSPVSLIKSQKMKIKYVFSTLIHYALQSFEGVPPSKRKIEIFLKEDDNYYHLEFHDTGKGLSSEVLSKLFGQGFSDPSVPDCFKLHICANYMLELNGKISVSSEGNGKGTIFYLEFNKVQ